MSVGRITLMGLRVLGVLIVGVLCAGTPALATEVYVHDYAFGTEGPGSGGLSNPQSVAVDQSTGDVYVFDVGSSAIYKFNAAGEAMGFSGLTGNAIEGVAGGGPGETELAVDSSHGPGRGDIYVANYNKFAVYGADGAPLGELALSGPCGVAVDQAGAVYTGLYPSSVAKYTPAANPVVNADLSATMGGLNAVCNVAVDGEGAVYAASYGGGVSKYAASDFGTGQPASGTPIDSAGRGLAVDPASNDVFVDEGDHVAQFGSSGALIRRFATLAGGSLGVAVSGTSHEAYVTNNSSGQVDAFKLTDVTPPVVGYQAPLSSRNGATVSGTVNTEGYEAHYRYVYGPTPDYVRSTPERDLAGGAGDQPAGPVSITGLLPGTTYHYALRATNIGGTTTGPDQTFTTTAATPPLVLTAAPSGVTQTAAVLSGSVDSQGLAGTYGFELGRSAAEYGPRIGLGVIRLNGNAVTPTLSLSGLEPGTTYHYRLTATNDDGTSYGADATFTTAALDSAYVRTPPSPQLVRTPVVSFPGDLGSTPKSSTNAQKLAKALKACKRKVKRKRAACERQARKKYAPTTREKSKKK